jgi:hypothetical protein
MIPLDGNEDIELVLDYNRKIRRPSFSNLNPYKLPGSEYLYISGNPKLKPSLSDDISLDLGLYDKIKYYGRNNRNKRCLWDGLD